MGPDTGAAGTLNWVQTLTNLGSFAVIVFGIVYLLPKAFQQAVQTYREVVAAHKDIQNQLAETFRRELAEFRSQGKESQDKSMATFKEEVESVRTRADARADKIGQILSDSLNRNTAAIERNTAALGDLEKRIFLGGGAKS